MWTAELKLYPRPGLPGGPLLPIPLYPRPKGRNWRLGPDKSAFNNKQTKSGNLRVTFSHDIDQMELGNSWPLEGGCVLPFTLIIEAMCYLSFINMMTLLLFLKETVTISCNIANKCLTCSQLASFSWPLYAFGCESCPPFGTAYSSFAK